MTYANGSLRRALVGGNWSNSSYCGSRSFNGNNVSANVNANIAARGTSDTLVIIGAFGTLILLFSNITIILRACFSKKQIKKKTMKLKTKAYKHKKAELDRLWLR
jgi:hypothetical protein